MLLVELADRAALMSAAPRPELELELGADLGDVGRRAILELGASHVEKPWNAS